MEEPFHKEQFVVQRRGLEMSAFVSWPSFFPLVLVVRWRHGGFQFGSFSLCIWVLSVLRPVAWYKTSHVSRVETGCAG